MASEILIRELHQMREFMELELQQAILADDACGFIASHHESRHQRRCYRQNMTDVWLILLLPPNAVITDVGHRTGIPTIRGGLAIV
jgi:hypothetical protein